MALFIPGPCGRLEAELWLPVAASGEEPPPPRATALVCHPHPLHGGSMQSPGVVRTARGLRRAGLAVLRFNFRGVGASEGESEASAVEEEDALVALAYLERAFPDLGLWVAGYSFGARVAAALPGRGARPARLVLVALPVKIYDCSALERLRLPGLVLMAGRDEFGTLADLRQRFPTLDSGLELDEIEDSDHFFRNRTPELEARVHAYALRSLEEST